MIILIFSLFITLHLPERSGVEINKLFSEKGLIFHSIVYEIDLDNDGINELFVRYEKGGKDSIQHCKECCGSEMAILKFNKKIEKWEIKSAGELGGGAELSFIDFNNDGLLDIVEMWDLDIGSEGPDKGMIVYLNKNFRFIKVFKKSLWIWSAIPDEYHDLLLEMDALGDEKKIFKILSKKIEGYGIFYRKDNEIGLYANFFRDLDGDGIKEIQIYIPPEGMCSIDFVGFAAFPPIFSIYSWNGNEYKESNDKFIWKYKKIQKYYEDAILRLKKAKEEFPSYNKDCINKEIKRYENFLKWISEKNEKD